MWRWMGFPFSHYIKYDQNKLLKTSKNICVVGAGRWGKNHIRALHDLGALGGIVEPREEVLTELLNEYDGVQGYASLNEALANSTFTGFVVATPAETHHEIASKIISTGKHVLVEKPLALTIEDAEEMVNLADKYAVNLLVGHLLLFHPAIIKIKELINGGTIGNLQYIYSNRLNLGQVRTEENVFWSFAPHDISIFQYFTDSYPEQIKAQGSTFLQNKIHDSTITQFKYPNNVEGHIFVSWLHPFKEHRLVVIGSEAMITFEDSAEGKPLKLYSKKIDMESGIPEKIDGQEELIEYEHKMPLTEELKYFIEYLGHHESMITNGKHAVDVIKILVEASVQLQVGS